MSCALPSPIGRGFERTAAQPSSLRERVRGDRPGGGFAASASRPTSDGAPPRHLLPMGEGPGPPVRPARLAEAQPALQLAPAQGRPLSSRPNPGASRGESRDGGTPPGPLPEIAARLSGRQAAASRGPTCLPDSGSRRFREEDGLRSGVPDHRCAVSGMTSADRVLLGASGNRSAGQAGQKPCSAIQPSVRGRACWVAVV